jgi:hypothetical protein
VGPLDVLHQAVGFDVLHQVVGFDVLHQVVGFDVHFGMPRQSDDYL